MDIIKTSKIELGVFVEKCFFLTLSLIGRERGGRGVGGGEKKASTVSMST